MPRKIVIQPSKCPFRSNVMGTYFCNHPSMSLRYCSWTDDTPDNCPMTPEMMRTLKIKKIMNDAEKNTDTTR